MDKQDYFCIIVLLIFFGLIFLANSSDKKLEYRGKNIDIEVKF